MENNSRLKKYEDLRRSIDTNNEPIDDIQQVSNDFINRERVSGEKSSEYSPERENVDFYNEQDTSKKNSDNSTFTNEYLDDFIKEIRDYNIQKGNRNLDNTQADILHQLNSIEQHNGEFYPNRKTDENKNVSLTEEQLMETTRNEEIAMQVQDLLRDDFEDQNIVESTQNESEELPVQSINNDFVSEDHSENEQILAEVEQNIATNEEQSNDSAIFLNNNDSRRDNENTMYLNEVTQQLQGRIDECEEELDTLNKNVGSTNRRLNAFLAFLIISLVAILLFIGYMVLNVGGTI